MTAPLPFGDPAPEDPAALRALARERTLEHLRGVLRVRGLKPSEWRLLERLEAEAEGRQVVRTVEELAEALGVTKRTVLRWKKQGMPVLPSGAFDVEAVRRWRGLPDPEPSGEPAPDSAGGDPARAYKREQAELVRLKRLKMAGKLISRREVAREFARRVAAVKAGLLALPRAAAPDLVGLTSEREVIEALKPHVRALLEQYARPLPPELTEAEEDRDEDGIQT